MFAQPHVLIVEDSYILLEMFRTICARCGFGVLEASSGEDALTILRRGDVEIEWLLTDIALPGLVDGWDVADAFRASHPGCPVIYASAAAPGRARPVENSLFVRKPFQIHEMQDLVAAMKVNSDRRRRLVA